ncbi:MAG: hypothetical protein GXY01_02560 [Clostridiales bacterium]|jgi:uncharacterized protein YaaQ|nr:hypothetical protein [Clostridiales bacterium]
MKLLIAVTSKSDAPNVASAMSKAGYPSTIVDSYGGFLKQENAVIFSGIDDTKVGEVMKIVKDNTSGGMVEVPPDASFGDFKLPKRVKKGKAVVFVSDVEQFVRL